MNIQGIRADAKCPFFVDAIKTRNGQLIGIICEAIMDEKELGFNVQTVVRQKTEKECEAYADMFCACDYMECPYSKTISEKYKDR